MKPQQTFEEFVAYADSQLRRAYAWNMAPDDIPRAVGGALDYAWLHRRRLQRAANPVGFLYRVGQSQVAHTKRGWKPWTSDANAPDVDAGFPRALATLPRAQAAAVWLVRACGWTNVQVGEALTMSPSTVATNVDHAMERLGQELDDQHD